MKDIALERMQGSPKNRHMLTVLLTGLVTTMALIVAIGPQSVWLLRQGLRRDHVAVAVACCLVGDIVLISLGTLGVGVMLDYAPWLLDVIRWIGVTYLLWFAARSFYSAWKPAAASAPLTETTQHTDTVHVEMTSARNDDGGGEPLDHSGPRAATLPALEVTKVSTVTTVAATGLTLSILNPHAWVDSLVVLGTMANSFGADKWWFAAGAVLASVIWLSALAGGSAALSSLLNRRRTWQIIDLCVGVIMVTVAGVLAVSGF